MKRKIEVKNRKGIIGGSDVGAILGVSPYRTPYQAYVSFMGMEEEEKTPEVIERLAMGTELEEFIAKQITRVFGSKLRKSDYAYYREETPYIVCHPDRIEVGKDEEGRTVGVEIKSSSAFDNSWGEPDTDQIPYTYLCQCLMYMYCGVCDTVKLYRFSTTHSPDTSSRKHPTRIR
jgi:Phage-related protein, predicted endonuclease